jgi:Family of unknown function (DUF6515)
MTKFRSVLIVALGAGLLAVVGGASAGPLDNAIKKLHEQQTDQKSNQAPSKGSDRKPDQGSGHRQEAPPPRNDRSRGSFGSVAPPPRTDSHEAHGNDRGRDQGPSHNLNEDLARLHGNSPGSDRNEYHDRGGAHGGTRDHRPPRVVQRLPSGYRDYYWNGSRYYFYGGSWYRPYGSSFITIGIPFGLFVTTLPGYYTSFWYDGTRYFYADHTYYVFDSDRRGYVVSHSPYDDDDEAYDDSAPADDLYVYPAKGQSDQQQADDRYECHRWAADQTHYDPLNDQYDADRNADYRRAMIACLTGRGYSVN